MAKLHLKEDIAINNNGSIDIIKTGTGINIYESFNIVKPQDDGTSKLVQGSLDDLISLDAEEWYRTIYYIATSDPDDAHDDTIDAVLTAYDNAIEAGDFENAVALHPAYSIVLDTRNAVTSNGSTWQDLNDREKQRLINNAEESKKSAPEAVVREFVNNDVELPSEYQKMYSDSYREAMSDKAEVDMDRNLAQQELTDLEDL